MRRALFLSLLIHALLLLGVMKLLPARLDAPPAGIQVVLGSAQVAEQNPPALTARPSPVASPSPVVARQKPQQIVSDRSPVVVSSPAPVVAQAVAEAALPPGRPNSPERAATGVTATLHEAVNADDLRQYRISLAVAARRFKRYPALARERGWEGAVEVSLSVGAHHSVPEVTLTQSSGHAVLDQQAQEMMTQAARSTALPDSLKGRDFRMLLPVKFSLEGD